MGGLPLFEQKQRKSRLGQKGGRKKGTGVEEREETGVMM